MKVIATRFEELRKRHAEYADKLEKEKEGSYGELRKTKTKYDAVCQEVESKRKKSESSFDKAKAQSAYQQQMIEMHNMKNTYLININVTNKQKDMYYHEYLPELMDSMQDLNEFRVLKLNGLWTLASQLEATMLQSSGGLIENQTQEISRNDPHLDSMMYMRHNMGAFNEPPDKVFEPSPVWHDEPTMVVDEPAKIYLRNVLNKSKSQLGELRREVDKKKREVESAQKVKQNVRKGTENKDEVTVVASIFALQEELHALDRKKVTAEVETSTITSVVGDVTLGAKNHNFKSQTFKIPTNCDLCGERIWGLSAKGFDCRDCGYTCHSKCEMKVPAECPGESSKEERKKLKQQRQEAANSLLAPNASGGQVAELPALSRSNTMNSLSSGYAASAQRSATSAMSPTEEAPPPEVPTSTRPTSSVGAGSVRKNRLIAPPPSSFISELPGSSPNGSGGAGAGGDHLQQKAKMLYTFEANGDGEITVPEGRELTVLEPDSESILPHIVPTRHECTLTVLFPSSWIWLGQSPRRLQRRSRARVLRGDAPARTAAHRWRVLGAAGEHVLEQRVVDRRRPDHQEEGPRCGAEAGRQEAKVRRGSVRLHGAERRGAQHGRGRAVRAGEGGSRGRLGRGREGRGQGKCAGELCAGRVRSTGRSVE